MKPIWKTGLACAAAFGALVGPVQAEEASASPAIEHFAFMAGHWRGEGFGATVEEIWSEPLGGTMVGSFRLVKDGQVEIYELMVLGPDAEGFALKVKHFSEDFAAWEEKADAVRFAYEKVDGNRAEFKGLKISREGKTLTIEVRMRHGDDVRWETLTYQRQAPR